MWSFCYVNGISHLQLKVVLLPNEFINTCCYIAYPTVTHIWQREAREKGHRIIISHNLCKVYLSQRDIDIRIQKQFNTAEVLCLITSSPSCTAHTAHLRWDLTAQRNPLSLFAHDQFFFWGAVKKFCSHHKIDNIFAQINFKPCYEADLSPQLGMFSAHLFYGNVVAA